MGTRSSNLFDHESSNLNQPLLPLDSNFANGNEGRPYFATRPGLNVVLPLDVARLSMFYNALQTSLEHRFSGGFNVLASYTFAKSLGTADGNVNQCDIQNAHDVAAEKGPTTPDFRHQLVISYVYELPFGKGKHFGSEAPAVAQAVLGGWQVAGVTTAHSGEAFDVLMGSDLTNTGAFPPRPDIIHNPYDFSFNIAGRRRWVAAILAIRPWIAGSIRQLSLLPHLPVLQAPAAANAPRATSGTPAAPYCAVRTWSTLTSQPTRHSG